MTRRPPFTRADLDGMKCGVPGCKHDHPQTEGMFLHGRCHVGAGNEVEYREGVLYVRCRLCKLAVGEFAVAPGPVPQ